MSELNNKRSIEESDNVLNKETPALTAKKPNIKGIAQIKPEFIVSLTAIQDTPDDDLAEASRGNEDSQQTSGKGKKFKKRGQNKARDLRQSHENIKLCGSVIDPEDSSRQCKFGAENCKFSHNVEKYLNERLEDIPGTCPVWEELGYCPAGLKCRWLMSHYVKENKKLLYKDNSNRKQHSGEINITTGDQKNLLQKRKFPLPISDKFIYLNDKRIENENTEERKKLENEFNESIIKQSEKKKLDFKNKKIVSPLTTVGNLPFRRLMRSMGADITYSEMALALPVIQGSKSEWALIKAHESEYPGFGVQLATSKVWQAAKAAEIVSKLATNVSELNLNCGCPIDLLYRKGEGSALMENSNRMKLILKAMNKCSGDLPVTVKMRIGVKDNKPLAENIIEKLLDKTGGDIGAITIHGRSRQQRYTKEADWNYIGKIGKIIKTYNEGYEEKKDECDRPNPVYLIGNGDCFTYEDWYEHTSIEGIDSVMVARGALIKPWIFEEIDSKQYLDKTSTERLEILEKYSKFALDHWGTDEFGVNTARRYLCEFMSFTHRYIPVGILEKLPPKLNERPPQWKGRDELETLLGSGDYKDWIKISEMFLGKASENFTFIPKHKSNSFENTR